MAARDLSRRAFLFAGAPAVLGLAGCAGNQSATESATAGSSLSSSSASAGGTDPSGGSNTSSIIGGVATQDTGSTVADVHATATTAEEVGTVVDDDGLREHVQMTLPSMDGTDFDHVSPDPKDSVGTVANAQVDPSSVQQFFLWEKGNMPAARKSSSGYDPSGFRPTVTHVPVASGTDVKGAVLLCAGGAFAIRGDNSDCYPTASALTARGYHCFVVDYRVHPNTQAESGLDLARAIRFVRAHWRDYGLPSRRHIAIGGYSAGGILCGEAILNQGGAHSPSELDSSYAPDKLDQVNADVAACAIIYSFYGRLSVAEKSAAVLRKGSCPPTYYCYGTRDPFYDQFEGQVDLMNQIGYRVRARVLQNWPHGFGGEGGWVPEFDNFMQNAFAQA